MRLRIGVTQRVESVTGRPEVRDSLDQDWTRLLDQCGYSLIAIPNLLQDPVDWCLQLNIHHFIFSGGGDWGEDPCRDLTETRLWEAAQSKGWKILGVCRGMQVLNILAGGRLEKIDDHVGVSHPILFNAIERFDPVVNSFHRWGIKESGLAGTLVKIAWTKEGCVEAFRSQDGWLLGIMWHPEREPKLSKNNLFLLKGFFDE